MHTDSEYEKIAIIVILSGCGVAIALAFAVLICCQLLVKPKYSRYSCHPNSQIITFERQTTTSDENNAEYYSCCYEDSVYQQQQCDSDTNGDTISSPNTVIAQTHYTPQSNTQLTPNSQQRSTSPQVKFAARPVKTRKASLPCKLACVQPKRDNCSNELTENQRRASTGIIRQKCFEDIDEEISYTQTETADMKLKELSDSKEVISIDVLRKQYRELWQLRATFEAEEMELSNESSDSLPSNQPQRNIDQKLTKNDSGYKSIERRDYSIDYKTEYIFRQFTATTPQRHSIHHQQSIKEEQESEIQATFV